MIVPTLVHAFTATVTLGTPIEQGLIDRTRKRFIPITGGVVEGPRLEGVVLPGGGDWQTVGDDGLTRVEARYTLRADDGTVIGITNPGIRVAAPEVADRLFAGEDVDPETYYFRTAPVFEVAAGRHEWLRRTLFVARGIRKPDHVTIIFFAVD